MTNRKFSFFPRPLGGCIERLTRPAFRAQGLAGTNLLLEWEKVVGAELAAHSVPEKLSFPKGKTVGGTLTVAVENGFATEMQHMQPIILERLAVYFGYKAVERLSISHAWLPALPDKTPAPRRAALAAADVEIATQAEDGELQEALASLAKTLAGQST